MRNKELMDDLLIEKIRFWESKFNKTKKFTDLFNYIEIANLRYLAFYKTGSLIDKDKAKKADLIFIGLFGESTFVEQLKDLNIMLNIFLDKRYIKLVKKILINSIILTYRQSNYDNIKKKQMINNFKSFMSRYDFLWIIFILKYYKLYFV